MANLIAMNLTIAQSVANFVSTLRKKDSYKRAQKEYVSLSHVCHEIKEIWEINDENGTTYGYRETFEALGVVSIEWITPKLLSDCHADLTTMEDGKLYETIHKAVNVYLTDANGRVMRDAEDKKIKKTDADGNYIYELNTYLIKGWNPATLIQYLAEDRALRMIDFEKKVRKENPKASDTFVGVRANEMYKAYVAEKFAPKTAPKERKPRTNKKSK